MQFYKKKIIAETVSSFFIELPTIYLVYVFTDKPKWFWLSLLLEVPTYTVIRIHKQCVPKLILVDCM